jgi:putative endonuclease
VAGQPPHPRRPDGRDALGRRGEQEAARYLRRLGYRIVGQRERVLRGDIDLVALDGRCVVFVEVRSRSDTTHGHPAETVGPVKQRRIAELATVYIHRHGLEDCQARIDVVAVTFPAQGSPIVEHYQNAFDSPW